jgi:DNA-binding protein HU-beta
MAKIGKSDFVKAVAKNTGESQAKVQAILDGCIEELVKSTVGDGNEVQLNGLGIFKRKVNSAREGINPLTKENISIKESHTIGFKPSSGVKVVIEPKAKTKGKK